MGGAVASWLERSIPDWAVRVRVQRCAVDKPFCLKSLAKRNNDSCILYSSKANATQHRGKLWYSFFFLTKAVSSTAFCRHQRPFQMTFKHRINKTALYWRSRHSSFCQRFSMWTSLVQNTRIQERTTKQQQRGKIHSKYLSIWRCS